MEEDVRGVGMFVFFFLQAEDGIRDAQESRGLGDVYKRQLLGLAARALTANTPGEERSRAKSDLSGGRIQVLCVVDLFNEGVDIPDVNTLFFLSLIHI